MRWSLILAVLLCGCATASWTKPNGTAAMLEQDKAQCDYEAEAATANNQSAVAGGIESGILQRKCLQARGWKN